MIARTSRAIDISVIELERIAALGWRGTGSERLGDWLLRTGGGFTGRANSVLPLGSPGPSLRVAIERVSAHYAASGLPPRFQLAPGLPGATRLTQVLTDGGWTAGPPVAVMVGDLPAVLATCPPRPDLPDATMEPWPSTSWIDGYRYRGGRVPDSAITVLTAAERPVFATLADRRGRLAVGRGVVDEGWLGITAVTVEPDRRRGGVATHLLAELSRWALGYGARFGYLQVDAGNEPALALYRRRGFVLHHDYRYWDPPAGTGFMTNCCRPQRRSP